MADRVEGVAETLAVHDETKWAPLTTEFAAMVVLSEPRHCEGWHWSFRARETRSKPDVTPYLGQRVAVSFP